MNTKNHTASLRLSDRELKIAAKIQSDLPIVSHPFLEVGIDTGFGEGDVIETLRSMIDKKIIRKLGAVLRHQKAGFTENAILVLSITEGNPGQTEAAGKVLSSFQEISHCYQREPKFLGKYGLFAMVHSRPGEIDGRIKGIMDKLGITDFLVLQSLKEFKKTSMELF